MDPKKKSHGPPPLPGLLKISALILGLGSLFYFFVFLVFHTHVSLNLNLDIWQALALDTGLSGLFFVQHSLMVRQRVKDRFNKTYPLEWFPAWYAIVSGITLVCTVFFWQQAGAVLFLPPFWVKIVMNGFMFFALAGFLWGVKSLSGNPLGIESKTENRSDELLLQFTGPYRLVRHPLYFFSLVLIWSTTVITVDRLLFNVIWTIWIFLGTWFEEKDLVRFFGQDYMVYQQQTPMIIPLKWPHILWSKMKEKNLS
jgi:protein-S-isoprenylcysteine O-methyltransferase Ste14